jgi:hypothetical protein
MTTSTQAPPALQEAIESLRKAMIAGDRAELAKWASESLMFGHASGRFETKQEYIDFLAKKPWAELAFSDQRVTLVDDLALVHQAVIRARDKGREKVKEMAVWRLEKGRWALLSRQTTNVPL